MPTLAKQLEGIVAEAEGHDLRGRQQAGPAALLLSSESQFLPQIFGEIFFHQGLDRSPGTVYS